MRSRRLDWVIGGFALVAAGAAAGAIGSHFSLVHTAAVGLGLSGGLTGVFGGGWLPWLAAAALGTLAVELLGDVRRPRTRAVPVDSTRSGGRHR